VLVLPELLLVLPELLLEPPELLVGPEPPEVAALGENMASWPIQPKCSEPPVQQLVGHLGAQELQGYALVAPEPLVPLEPQEPQKLEPQQLVQQRYRWQLLFRFLPDLLGH
jgi:hypothetical protein